MRIKKCTVCGVEFLSTRGIEVCGDSCFAERKKKYYAETATRRKAGTVGNPIISKCLYCGKAFNGLGRKYCTDECSNNARQIQRNKIFKEHYEDARWRDKHIENVKERKKRK
jgi:hypothetical protein